MPCSSVGRAAHTGVRSVVRVHPRQSLVEVKVEKDDPGRKGSDLCSETVGDTELTYGHDPTVGQILICMARQM